MRITDCNSKNKFRENTIPATQNDLGLQPRLLGTLLANLEGMVYRCRVDENWTMEFISEGCLALTGYRVEDLMLNTWISYEEVIHPDDRLHVRNVIYQSLEQRTRFDLEYRIVRFGGEVRWVWERGTGIVNADGQLEALEGFIQDITQRMDAADALREAERRYRSIFENTVEGIFQSAPGRGYIAVNPALARIYGYESAELLIANLTDIERQLYVEPHRRAEFIRIMEEKGAVINFESRVYTRSGEIIWISENARAVRGVNGTIEFFEGTVEPITERKLHEAQIRYQATHDVLTGLPNRLLLDDRIKQATLRAQRNGSLAAVVFMDLDQFKYINDSLGHQIGDQLLITVAERLTACLRESDTVARQGGDEFVLVLDNQPNAASITQTMQRLLQAIAQPWTFNEMEFQVTCSMGITVYPSDGKDMETLLKNADLAMYRAKDLGRNNFQYFAAEMNTMVVERLGILGNLRRALANDEFELFYQPKISLSSGRIVGVEALIRWHSAEKGMVSPAHFVPLAEETGLILPIGEWVLRTACAQNIAWQNAGYPPMTISVNLSPRQLERGNIVDSVVKVLEETGLAANYLELEITESVVMRDVEKTFATLAKLKELGVKIAIDDFGTGYSSLSYLKRFPLDTLKIDRSFVCDITGRDDDTAIIKAIISLGHILNLNVLAEGVETKEQYRFLLENGCDEVQGYYFGKPMPHAAFAELLKRE